MKKIYCQGSVTKKKTTNLYFIPDITIKNPY